MKKRHEQKFVVLAISVLLALNIPFILIFDSSDAVLGVPVLYLYIFSIWFITILITYRILNKYYE